MNLLEKIEEARMEQEKKLLERGTFFEQARNLVESDIFPQAPVLASEWSVDSFSSLDIEVPRNPKILQEFYDHLRNLGWDAPEKAEKDDRNAFYYHEETPIKIYIYIMEKMDGATCKRVVIGTNIVKKEVDVIEWVCNEGAEEGAF